MTGKTGSNMISMCIVPVEVKHRDGKDMITTYAMLGNCSQGSFIEGIKVTAMSADGSLLSLLKLYARMRYQLTKKKLQPWLKSRNGSV